MLSSPLPSRRQLPASGREPSRLRTLPEGDDVAPRATSRLFPARWLLMALAVVAAAGAASACRRETTAQAAPETSKPKPVVVDTAVAVEEPIARFLNVSGTLTAQEQAEVAAEVAGRVVGTPVE